jgi:mannosyltransferase OCH1-like enzyme
MIPKKIHYCWFGGAPIPENVRKCIDSWERMCPEFEIIEWNEKNYDIHKHSFLERAYQEKKWAFVSDYARLDILQEQGGIYLDTDVEVIKNLSPLCANKAFIGFEEDNVVADGLALGGIPHFEMFKEMMDEYNNVADYIPSPRMRTAVLLRHGLKLDGTRQTINGMEIYPVDYFCPLSLVTGENRMSDNTYSIHHYDSSWMDKQGLLYLKLRRKLIKILPMNISSYLAMFISICVCNGGRAAIKKFFCWIFSKDKIG